MDIEILHVTAGGKHKKFDTSTPEGRAEAGDLIKNMLSKGTALFLERGKKTYRITGYDAVTDSLLLTVEKKGVERGTKASGRKSKVAAVPSIRGGSTAEETLTEETLTEIPSIEETTAQILSMTHIPPEQRQALLAECLLRRELALRMREIAERARRGETITFEDMSRTLDEVATAHGFPGGIPMPVLRQGEDDPVPEHPLVLAGRAPLGQLNNLATMTTEHAERLGAWRKCVRNSWHSLGDHTITVVDLSSVPEEQRAGQPRHCAIKHPMAGDRMRKIMADLGIRADVHTMTAEAELTALASLKDRITGNQYRTYVLSGSFIERSRRSDIYYLFRKGRPTLALTFHGGFAREHGGTLLCALCFHPTGYYQFSHVGVMTPTDEVISALLMMRGDEHKFWAKSGQWRGEDPRSGL